MMTSFASSPFTIHHSLSLKHPLDLAKPDLAEHRPAVGAVAGEFGGVHLDEEGADLRRGERVAATHHAVAGDPGKDLLPDVGERPAPAEPAEFLQDVAQSAEIVPSRKQPRHSLQQPG